MPEPLDESQFRRQINVRLAPQAVRELRALAKATGEEYSPLIRRLIHEEHDKRGLAAEEATNAARQP